MPHPYMKHKPRRYYNNAKADPVLLQDALPLLRCPCGKVFAPTKEIARNLRRQIATAKENHNEVRYYQCEDGDSWHWTEKLEPYRICPGCGEDFPYTETDPEARKICDTCYLREHPPLPEPRPIPVTQAPTPNIFAKRNTPCP